MGKKRQQSMISFNSVSIVNAGGADNDPFGESAFTTIPSTRDSGDSKERKRKQNKPKNQRKPKKQKTKNRANNKSNAALHTSYFKIEKEEDSLGALYYLLQLRFQNENRIVVALDDRKKLSESKVPDAQYVANVLKQLSYEALGIHSKTPKLQRQDHLKRFSDSKVSTTIILVLTTKGLNQLPLISIPTTLISMTTSSKISFQKFVNCTECCYIDERTDDSSNEKIISKPNTMSRARSRLRLAASIVSESQANISGNNDDAWTKKLAKNSGLETTTLANTLNHGQQQRLAGMSLRMKVMLALPLELGNTKSVPNDVIQESLKLLGMTTTTAANQSDMQQQRLSAQTKWLDGASGASFGGEWEGDVRHGSTCDSTSLKVRKRFLTTLSPKGWEPNDAEDECSFGGKFGKPCGHNEIVMFDHRPFYPQQVLNSRVCSRAHPAPGNRGYDGCMEYLRLQCKSHGRVMTIWDSEAFHFISKEGELTSVMKTSLIIEGFSTEVLRKVLEELTVRTIACNGTRPPAILLQEIIEQQQ